MHLLGSCKPFRHVTNTYNISLESQNLNVQFPQKTNSSYWLSNSWLSLGNDVSTAEGIRHVPASSACAISCIPCHCHFRFQPNWQIVRLIGDFGILVNVTCQQQVLESGADRPTLSASSAHFGHFFVPSCTAAENTKNESFLSGKHQTAPIISIMVFIYILEHTWHQVLRSGCNSHIKSGDISVGKCEHQPPVPKRLRGDNPAAAANPQLV